MFKSTNLSFKKEMNKTHSRVIEISLIILRDRGKVARWGRRGVVASKGGQWLGEGGFENGDTRDFFGYSRNCTHVNPIKVFLFFF